MEKILVSACLLGFYTRYDGQSNVIKEINMLKEKYEIIPICPEIDGGMIIPRIPSEIKGDKVINKIGEDNTLFYQKGALHALEIAKQYGITKAILKSKSPSCGHGQVYDGTFTHTLIDGNGITTKILLEHDITVYNEHNFYELLKD